MPKGNKAVPRNHFRKEWQSKVQTWFDQPGKARRRKLLRNRKAASVFPRPLETLKPVVHPPSIRWNMKVRLGKGFTTEELKEAGIDKNLAQTIGIAVDYRRKNHSDQSLKVNVQRLKLYKSKLVLFPKDPKKVKAGEASADQTAQAQQHSGIVFPPKQPSNACVSVVKLSDVPKLKGGVYASLRKIRRDTKQSGARAKRAKEKAEKAALEKKPTATES